MFRKSAALNPTWLSEFNRFTTFNYEGKNTEGSGIGLSIVQKIVEVLKGKVWLTSVESMGTTFFVSIPFIPGTNQSQKPPKIKKIVKQKVEKRSGTSILLVEDEQNSQELIMKILEPMKLEIHCVNDGNDAIRHVIQNPDISLILMDLKLPKMDGLEATRIIKKVHPKIPIIAQTAYAMTGDREIAIAAGCDDYLTKPFSTSELLTSVKSHLKN